MEGPVPAAPKPIVEGPVPAELLPSEPTPAEVPGNKLRIFRGEAIGVGPSKPGGAIHDFGDGTYFTDTEAVANTYATIRASGNPAARASF